MGVYKRGKKWLSDFYLNGIRVRKTFPTKKTAEAYENKHKLAELVGLDVVQQSSKKISLSDFIKQFNRLHGVHSRESTQTLNGYIFSHFESFIGKEILVSQINEINIEEYKAARLKRVKPVTVNIELRVIRSLLNKAVDWGYLTASPMKKIKLIRIDQKAPRFLRPDEGAKVIATAKGQMKTFIMMGLYTGLRKGEMFRLKWADIDFNRCEIRVEFSKGRKFRIVPLSSLLKSQLDMHPRHENSAFVFHNSDGSPWRDVRGGFNSVFKRANIERIRIHDMRHSFISNLVASGVDLRTVKELVGHASIQTTMRYAHLSQGQTKIAIEKLCWAST